MVIILSHGVGIRFALFVAEAYALFAHLHLPVGLSVYQSKLQASCQILTQWKTLYYPQIWHMGIGEKWSQVLMTLSPSCKGEPSMPLETLP